MPPHMVFLAISQTGYGHIRRVPVSLVLVPQLLDEGKYMLPGDVKPPEDRTEAYRQRAPSLRFLVRLAVKCESAEELGKKVGKAALQSGCFAYLIKPFSVASLVEKLRRARMSTVNREGDNKPSRAHPPLCPRQGTQPQDSNSHRHYRGQHPRRGCPDRC